MKRLFLLFLLLTLISCSQKRYYEFRVEIHEGKLFAVGEPLIAYDSKEPIYHWTYKTNIDSDYIGADHFYFLVLDAFHFWDDNKTNLKKDTPILCYPHNMRMDDITNEVKIGKRGAFYNAELISYTNINTGPWKQEYKFVHAVEVE